MQSTMPCQPSRHPPCPTYLRDEHPRRPEHEQPPRPPPVRPHAVPLEHARLEAAVEPGLGGVDGERVVARVQQVGVQVAHRPVHAHFLVHQRVGESPAVAAEQAQDRQRIPAAMADRASEVRGQPGDPVADVRGRCRQGRLDLVTQRRGDELIGVDAEDPRLAGLSQRERFLLAESLPHGTHDHARAAGTADLRGGVGAVTVDHDQLLGPAHRVQTPGNARRLVARDHDHREPGTLRHASPRGGRAAGRVTATRRASGTVRAWRARCPPTTTSTR